MFAQQRLRGAVHGGRIKFGRVLHHEPTQQRIHRASGTDPIPIRPRAHREAGVEARLRGPQVEHPHIGGQQTVQPAQQLRRNLLLPHPEGRST